MTSCYNRKYTEEENAFIRENYGKDSSKEIANALGRSVSSVKHQAQRIGCAKKQSPHLDLSPMSGEEWRDVPGFDGYYQVSNMGRVKSVDRFRSDGIRIKGVLLRTHHDACGYELVCLNKNGKHKHYSVHRLVALAFIPNPDNLPQVNHIDEVRNHNTASNLEWCSIIYNQNYGHRKERTSRAATGEKNANSKLTDSDVIEIRKTYIPGDKDFGVRALSEKYGVKYVTISKITSGAKWKHLLKEETA